MKQQTSKPSKKGKDVDLAQLQTTLIHYQNQNSADVSKLLPHVDAVNLMNNKIGSLKFRLAGCISLATLKISEQKQEKNACYDYISSKVGKFSGVSEQEATDLWNSFDGYCRLHVDSAIFSDPDLSCDSSHDLMIYLWLKSYKIISVRQFASWWSSSKNERGSTRGEILFVRFREQVKNLSKVWLDMLFQPSFAVTGNACYSIGIWERQFFWNRGHGEYCLLDIMVNDRRKKPTSTKRKAFIFGMHNIDDDDFPVVNGFDSTNTPLLKMTNDYCEIVNGVFRTLEAWYFQNFGMKKAMNLEMFGLTNTDGDDDKVATASSVQTILRAINDMKYDILGGRSETDFAANRLYDDFTKEYSKLQTFFLEHETRALLGAFKFENGNYLRRLSPEGGVLPKEVLGDRQSFFNVGYRAPFVGKFFRMVYILHFSQHELILDELMRNRDLYFSKMTTESVLGVKVPPISVFIAHATQSLQGLKDNKVAFSILLTLIDAFDSVLDGPSKLSQINIGDSEKNPFHEQKKVFDLEDDVIVLRHTCNDDSISEITGLTGMSSRSGTSYFTNLPKLAYYG